MTSRRGFLKTSAASVAGSVVFAGCLGRSLQDEPSTETPTDERNGANPDPASNEAFESWEPDTICNDGEQEAMYNSEISVQNVRKELDDSYHPIAYDDLPDEEKQLLAKVLENGGHATCDPAGAFQSFLERAVNEYAAKQEDDRKIFLEYDDTYYRLYIRKQDQVYAY